MYIWEYLSTTRNALDVFFNNNSWERMQYTGLKDRLGREIYEGDIVECPGYGDIESKFLDKMEVVYWNGAYSLSAISGCYGGILIKTLSYDLTPHILVIGNIFENPELVKNYANRLKV